MRIVTLSGLGLGLALLLTGAPALAAEKTMNGAISDSMCNGKHASKDEHGVKVPDADCTKACIDKGGKYVFVSRETLSDRQSGLRRTQGPRRSSRGPDGRGERQRDHRVERSRCLPRRNPREEARSQVGSDTL